MDAKADDSPRVGLLLPYSAPDPLYSKGKWAPKEKAEGERDFKLKSHLTPKQRYFISLYLDTFDLGKSAKVAGLSKKKSLGPLEWFEVGRAEVKKVEVAEELQTQLRERIIAPDAILLRLQEQAFANVSDFYMDVVQVEEDGTEVVVDHCLDWDQIRLKGHLIKEITQEPRGKISIKLYDAQAALALLGKYYKLFTDALDLTQSGSVTVKVVKGVSYDDL